MTSSPTVSPRHHRSDRRIDRGSMLVLTILVAVAIVTAVATAMVPFANDLLERQRAQTAADAAALAGVNGGRSVSAELAAANGATLLEFQQSGRTVTVTVVLGESTATARASGEP